MSPKLLLLVVGAAFVGGAVASQSGPPYLASLLAEAGAVSGPKTGLDFARGEVIAASPSDDISSASTRCQTGWPYQDQICGARVDKGKADADVSTMAREANARPIRVIAISRPDPEIAKDNAPSNISDLVRPDGPAPLGPVVGIEAQSRKTSVPNVVAGLEAAKAEGARAERQVASLAADAAMAEVRAASAREDSARVERERLARLTAERAKDEQNRMAAARALDARALEDRLTAARADTARVERERFARLDAERATAEQQRLAAAARNERERLVRAEAERLASERRDAPRLSPRPQLAVGRLSRSPVGKGGGRADVIGWLSRPD